jgi:hypothetical protein
MMSARLLHPKFGSSQIAVQSVLIQFEGGSSKFSPAGDYSYQSAIGNRQSAIPTLSITY